MDRNLFELQAQVTTEVPLLFGGNYRDGCFNRNYFSSDIDAKMKSRCMKVLKYWHNSCEKSDFCSRHDSNWMLMTEELASYMTGTHFPHTVEEISQFFAHNTVDAAFIFCVYAKEGRTTCWEQLLSDPQKWVNDPIFYRMKESIKSIRRHYIFTSVPTSWNEKKDLNILITRLGGIEKAKECFRSNCLIPYKASDSKEIEEITTNYVEDIFTNCYKLNPFVEGFSQVVPNTWTPAIRVGRKVSGLLEINDFLGRGAFGLAFHGNYRNKHVVLKFNLLNTDYFHSPATPYIGIDEEISHSKLGDRIRPWVAGFVTSVDISDDGLPLIYENRWVSNTAMIYEFVDKVGDSIPPFCLASQMILASKAMVNEGIVHADFTYRSRYDPNFLFSKDENVIIKANSINISCPAMKLIDLGALRTLEEHKFISGWDHLHTRDSIAFQYMREQIASFDDLIVESKYSKHEYLLLKSILAYALSDLTCDETLIELEGQFFKEVRMNEPPFEKLTFELVRAIKSRKSADIPETNTVDSGELEVLQAIGGNAVLPDFVEPRLEPQEATVESHSASSAEEEGEDSREAEGVAVDIENDKNIRKKRSGNDTLMIVLAVILVGIAAIGAGAYFSKRSHEI
jgi:hypothetical protein